MNTHWEKGGPNIEDDRKPTREGHESQGSLALTSSSLQEATALPWSGRRKSHLRRPVWNLSYVRGLGVGALGAFQRTPEAVHTEKSALGGKGAHTVAKQVLEYGRRTYLVGMTHLSNDSKRLMTRPILEVQLSLVVSMLKMEWIREHCYGTLRRSVLRGCNKMRDRTGSYPCSCNFCC